MQELPALNIKEMPPPGPDATPEQIEAYAQAMAADDNARKAAKDADEAHGRQMDIESDYGRIGPIGQEEIREAAGIMEKYKQGKKNLDERIVANEEWYKMRHWEQIRKKRKRQTIRSLQAHGFSTRLQINMQTQWTITGTKCTSEISGR